MDEIMKNHYILKFFLSLLLFSLFAENGSIDKTYARASDILNSSENDQSSTARVILTFDDGTRDHFDIAFPELQERGIKGTFYIVTDCLIDGCLKYPDAMSVLEAQTMYENGMDIANHTMTHTSLSSSSLALSEVMAELSSSNLSLSEIKVELDPNLSLSEIEAELLGAKIALDSLGMTRASNHIAYPYGAYDNNVLTAMANTGMLTGRTTKPGIETMDEIYNANKLYELSIHGVEEQDDWQTITGWIDEAITRNATLILMFHRIREIPLPDIGENYDPYDISRLKFEQILDYILTTGVECKTITEWFADYLNYLKEIKSNKIFFPLLINN